MKGRKKPRLQVEEQHHTKASGRQITTLIGLLLLIAVALVYASALANDFVNYDDGVYVTENEHVKAGLTQAGIVWAFTTNHTANWHPLTWLSHMLDIRIYGLNPWGHHLTNALLHTLNTLLLFFLFASITGKPWRSGFVAALFAMHPLHVESVAWVAERKDVLCAFFWLLTTLAYIRYCRRPGIRIYLVVFPLYALALMSKPMAVSLPLTLLMLDYWPLERLSKDDWRGRVVEKIPLFILAAASCVVTFIVQRSGGAVGTLDFVPLWARIANALVSYAQYIVMTFWPVCLAAMYPHPGIGIPMWQVVVSAIALIVTSILVFRFARAMPYLAIGWLWYIITLVPVIGLIQVGRQALADRYTYIPLIGIFVMAAWGIPDLIKAQSERKPAGKADLRLAIPAFAVILALTWLSRTQVGYWKNSITLSTRAVECTKDNYIMLNNLGLALDNEGRTAEAIPHYEAGVKALLKTRSLHRRDAAEHARALALQRANLGADYLALGRKAEALAQWRLALKDDPKCANAMTMMGIAIAPENLDGAIALFRRAIVVAPNNAEAHAFLAVGLFEKKDYAGAWREIRLARKYRAIPAPNFIRELSSKMPEPKEDF